MQGRATDPLTDGSATRLLVATAFSVVCHLGVMLLVSVATWHAAEVAAPRLIAVALVGGGGGAPAGGEPAGTGESTAPGPAIPASAIAAPVVPAPAVRVAPPRKEPPIATRRERTSEPRAVAAVKEPAPERLAAVDGNASAPAPVSAPAAALGGSGSGGDGSGAGTGPGTGGGRGSGSGGGVGEGTGTGEGLRVWCRTCPAPEYPVRARRQGWEGTVHVDLAVDRDGAVVDARVGESSGFGPLDAAAVAAARRSRFTLPAGGDGLRGRLRYRFLLEDSTRARAAAADDARLVR